MEYNAISGLFSLFYFLFFEIFILLRLTLLFCQERSDGIDYLINAVPFLTYMQIPSLALYFNP